jgi:hypothetical protein
MNSRSPGGQVVVSDVFFRTWVFVVVVLGGLTLTMGVTLTFQKLRLHRLEAELKALMQAQETCLEDLKTTQAYPVSGALSQEFMQAVENHVRKDLQLEVASAPLVNSETSPAFSLEELRIENPSVRFTGLTLEKDAQVTQMSFYVRRDPPLEDAQAPVDGGVVLVCQTQDNLWVLPDAARDSWREQKWGDLFHKGFDFHIRRAKRFLVDISPCLDNQASEVLLLAVSESGDFLGKAIYGIR